LLNKLEAGNKKIKALFKKVVSICIKGQTSLLSKLGIKYDSFDYESKYIGSKLIKDVLKKLKPQTKKDEEGRLVIDLSKFNLPMKSPFVPLTRGDGTSLYFLRDIVYNIEKENWSKGGKNLVVLGEDHKLEFLQIKSALSLLKHKAPEVIHYSFILLPEGKMSTRIGNIVLLTDFMREAVEKARHEISIRHPNIESTKLEKIAEIIGYGAIKYAILKVSAEKNVLFNWEQALSLDGESAPYIQYTHVRAKKILANAPKFKNEFVFSEPEEMNLIKKMGDFPLVVEKVSTSYEVHSLAKYTFELATAFNLFYEKCHAISETDEKKRNSRLTLIKAYSDLIQKSLDLLGINVPEFM
jgi:arginyl-tRNA synthetase